MVEHEADVGRRAGPHTERRLQAELHGAPIEREDELREDHGVGVFRLVGDQLACDLVADHPPAPLHGLHVAGERPAAVAPDREVLGKEALQAILQGLGREPDRAIGSNISNIATA